MIMIYAVNCVEIKIRFLLFFSSLKLYKQLINSSKNIPFLKISILANIINNC